MSHQPAIQLYWSARGQVACENHAPRTDDPRWAAEDWQALPNPLYTPRGASFQCQQCPQSGNPIRRPALNLTLAPAPKSDTR